MVNILRKEPSLVITDQTIADEVMNFYYDSIIPKLKKKHNGIIFQLQHKKDMFFNNFQIAVNSDNMSNYEIRQKKQEAKYAIYHKMGLEEVQEICKLVLGNFPISLDKSILLSEVMMKDMESTAIGNRYLDYTRYTDYLSSKGEIELSKIIKDCLNIAYDTISKGFTSISFSEDTVTFENGYGTTHMPLSEFQESLNPKEDK